MGPLNEQGLQARALFVTLTCQSSGGVLHGAPWACMWEQPSLEDERGRGRARTPLLSSLGVGRWGCGRA